MFSSFYLLTRRRSPPCGDVPRKFTKRNGFGECCSFLPFPFNFVTEMRIGMVLSSCEMSGTDISSDTKLSDFEYAVSVVLLFEDPNRVKDLLTAWTIVRLSLVGYAPPTCEKGCWSIGLSQSQALCMQEMNWVKYIGLVISAVASYHVPIYRMKWFSLYWRLD